MKQLDVDKKNLTCTQKSDALPAYGIRLYGLGLQRKLTKTEELENPITVTVMHCDVEQTRAWANCHTATFTAIITDETE